MRFGFVLVILLGGCDASVVVGDGGTVADGGSPDAAVVEGDFEVLVVHGGETVGNDSEMNVDFGCQGGAHVEVDVFASAGAPMRGATARVEVMGGPHPVDTTLRLEQTPDGGEVLAIIATFGDFMSFVSPGDFTFPQAATLRTTVTDAGGAVVVVERSVTLVMGSGCTCTYADPVPGTAVIDAFTVTGEASGCELVQVGLDVTFSPTDPMAFLFNEIPERHDFEWPASCVDALMLEVGAELSLNARDSFPGQPCDPLIYLEGPPRDAATCACPAE